MDDFFGSLSDELDHEMSQIQEQLNAQVALAFTAGLTGYMFGHFLDNICKSKLQVRNVGNTMLENIENEILEKAISVDMPEEFKSVVTSAIATAKSAYLEIIEHSASKKPS